MRVKITLGIFSVIVVGLALGAVGCSRPEATPSGSSTASTKPTPLSNPIAWGDVSGSGLQMGARRRAKTAWVDIFIRNGGRKTIRYNNYYLWYFEAFTLWGRPVGGKTWREIEYVKTPQYLKGAGPSHKEDRFLESGQQITLFSLMNDGAAVKNDRNFFISFKACKRPSWAQEDIEVRFKQVRLTYDNYSQWSGIITVPSEFLSASPKSTAAKKR